MVSPSITRKLENFTRLGEADKRALEALAQTGLRQFGAREDIVREGDAPEHINLVQDGWACRYKHLEDGRRQIISLFLPGDLCDLHVFILREMDHSIGTLTPVTVAQVSRTAFEELMLAHPRVLEALRWEGLVSAAIQREWTVNLGQRDATERVAHLLCELFLRLRAVELVDGESCDLPLTQTDIADATGLSSVHVNRTLQDLRSAGLIELKGRVLRVPDLESLMDAGLFNPNYLHLDREGQHLDANE